jgi:hypothetical protein
MDRTRPAIRAALAALLLLPAGAVRGGIGDASATLPDEPPLVDLAFRVVDESAATSPSLATTPTPSRRRSPPMARPASPSPCRP